MSLNKRELVQALPVFEGIHLKKFNSNIRPGDILIYQKSDSTENMYLPKRVTVLKEGPFHFLVDMGKYKSNINKASVYCKSSVLYIE